MFFASGGYANAELGDTTATFSGSCACGGQSGVIFDGKRFSGGFVGGGVETRINDALSLKAEYRYIDFSSERLTIADGILGPVPGDASVKFDPDIQMGRVSVNWRFNGSRAPGEPTTGPLD
jgi:outer membrane immunogenic protein